MTCPECGVRKARRACPALGRSICAVCCATKRLTEIQCPSDCPYLVSARQHPPAAQVRQQQRDLGHMVGLLRDLSEAQARVLLSIARFLIGYEPPDLHRLLDEDVEEAARALAATYETAAKGVIYEHPPQSLPADRLARALKPFLSELAEQGTSLSDPDRAAVLRHLAHEVQRQRRETPEDTRAFLSFAERVLRDPAEERGRPGEAGPGAPAAAPSRLILP